MTVFIPYTFVNGDFADATEVNANFDALASEFDAYLLKTGGTLSGALVLPNSDPTLNNHAARKKYVDDAIAANVVADGAITVGKLATDAVETVKIKDANVTVAKLATDAVETVKIKDGAVTSAKITWPSFVTWTPTWGGLTLGNSTVTAKSKKFGKSVQFKLLLTAGSTVSHTGAVTFTLPEAAEDTNWTVSGTWKSLTTTYFMLGIPTSTTVVKLYVGNINPTDLKAITTDGDTPTTLASGHTIVVTGWFEAAA